MGEHFLELNAQYVTEEQTFSITGKKGIVNEIRISPELVSANFNVSVNAERMVKQTPASRQASLQNLINTLQGISANAGVMMDFTPAIEALIDSYPEMENVEELVVSVDEKSKRDIAMLERGQEVEVKVRDPHMELLQAVQIHYEDNVDSYTEEINAVFGKYFTDHIRFLQSEKETQMMAQPQVAMPSSPQGLEAQMNNPDQAGIPNQGYNLGSLIPDKSAL
jgi:hypothetical protein